MKILPDPPGWIPAAEFWILSFMSQLQHVEWERPAVEPHRDLRAELRMLLTLGFVPEAMAYFMPCPWVVRAVQALDLFHFGLAHTKFTFAETIGLVVSQDNSCRYCYAASRAMLRFMGYSEERIRRLEENLAGAELDRRERLALDYARRVSRANPIPTTQEQKQLSEAGFSAGEIKETAYVAAVNVFYNRLSTMPALPPESIEQFSEGDGLFRVVRPILGLYLRTRRRHGKLVPLTAEERRGPYSSAVVALDGLPGAKVLRGVIDDAWRSPLLPRRQKALVMAVVARGLACAAVEREAKRELDAEGLDATAVDEILTHLGSPRLDAGETAIVRVARESIWYRPIDIQRQARTLREQWSEGQFLEFIGVAALANMICRLHAVEDGDR